MFWWGGCSRSEPQYVVTKHATYSVLGHGSGGGWCRLYLQFLLILYEDNKSLQLQQSGGYEVVEEEEFLWRWEDGIRIPIFGTEGIFT